MDQDRFSHLAGGNWTLRVLEYASWPRAAEEALKAAARVKKTVQFYSITPTVHLGR
jgi:hypothetical protein